MLDAVRKLKNGVVLAELGGWGDGSYCAEYAAGAALATMGTYIVDPGEDVPYPPKFVFCPGRSQYASYLREQVPMGRRGGVPVCVSAISIALADTVDFLVAAEEAGGDFVSLCGHSPMEMFVKHRLGQELCRRENAGLLREWIAEIVASLRIPLVLKTQLFDLDEMLLAIDTVAELGVPVVHVNVRDTGVDAPGLKALEQLAGHCDCLVASGGIATVEDARRVLAAGADAVSIGRAAMDDAGLCGRIQRALRLDVGQGVPE